MVPKNEWFNKGDVVVCEKEFFFYDEHYKPGTLILISGENWGHNFEEFCSLLHFAF
jgi:hypothetical protein